MRYVVLVSHGTFAPGLHSVLKMLGGGDREDVLSASMEDGMGADAFVERFGQTIAGIKDTDEIILLADIIGGSPLTNALDVLITKRTAGKDHGFWRDEPSHGADGSMMKDAMDLESLEVSLIQESQNAIQKMQLDAGDGEEAEI